MDQYLETGKDLLSVAGGDGVKAGPGRRITTLNQLGLEAI